jgi:HlyD family secretion protein
MTSPFNQSMKKRLLLAIVAVAVVIAGYAAYFQATAKGEAPQFTTVAVTRGDVVETVEATGTLQAVTTVQVGTQVSGTIQSLSADFNSVVKKGQVVARLDPSLLQAQVDQAEATVTRLQADVERARVTLEDAQLKLKRANELMKAQLIPATDLETAQSTMRQAEASLKSAEAQVTQARGSLNQNKVNLDHSIITAPVDGIVISRNVDVGQTVAASMSAPTLFVIAKDLTRMQVNASIDEADIGKIAKGQHVAFRVDAYPDETFAGTVSQVRLDPVVAQNVVSYVTVIDVPNQAMKLKPGMTANVTVEIARADDVLRVPNAALRFRPEGVGAGADATGARAAGAARRASANATPDGASNPGAAAPANATRASAGSGGAAGGGRGRRPHVWLTQNGQLQPVAVETGITDGTTTAIVGGELAENAQVITGVASTAAGATQPSTSPLLPFGGRGGRGGTRGTAAAGGGQRTGAGR